MISTTNDDNFILKLIIPYEIIDIIIANWSASETQIIDSRILLSNPICLFKLNDAIVAVTNMWFNYPRYI